MNNMIQTLIYPTFDICTFSTSNERVMIRLTGYKDNTLTSTITIIRSDVKDKDIEKEIQALIEEFYKKIYKED